MPENAIEIQIVGTNKNSSFGVSLALTNIPSWPNRCEIKRLGSERRLYLYSGDRLLLDTLPPVASDVLPDVFGLRFKRVVYTYVDFKAKTQHITAIFTIYEISIEIMHEFSGWDA